LAWSNQSSNSSPTVALVLAREPDSACATSVASARCASP
jgi:hypothetical protein